MQKYSEMSKEQLQAVKKELDQQYAEIKAQGLALDMSRGKPSNAAEYFHGYDGCSVKQHRPEM